MALAFGATVLDGTYTKIFTFTCLDNDAAANLTVALDGAGGRPNAFASAPNDFYLTRTANAADTANSTFAVTAVAANSITIRKLSAGGGANAITVRAVFHIVHSIES